ncbi:hypothetical protein PMAYCL1PPCAC_09272 [Pristionchus mayeri]|uniref:G protein-coupled receptor n=1 Tax=Pristionchus mayeri TaxID=1317129 RepID=A0AAN5CD51_9BILA|nr:hypothetical protein PMAYCL1PPCAC_09272 [Pristionchus mayeri]
MRGTTQFMMIFTAILTSCLLPCLLHLAIEPPGNISAYHEFLPPAVPQYLIDRAACYDMNALLPTQLLPTSTQQSLHSSSSSH